MSQDKLIYEEAEYLSDWGFACHWLVHKEKRPIESEWSNKPFYDWAALKSRYSVGNNLGVRLGKPSQVCGGYLHVLDVDVRAQGYAEVINDALRGILGDIDIEDLPSVRSGSGGLSRHYYLLLDKPLDSKKLKHSRQKYLDKDGKSHLLWEIDLFGTGKQVVLPQSIHPTGGIYQWEREFDFENPIIYDSLIFARWTRESKEGDVIGDADDIKLLNILKKTGISGEEIYNDLCQLNPIVWREPREKWLEVGFAIHFEFDGSDEGFHIWDKWSKPSGHYDPKDQRRVWNSMSNSKEKPKTLRSILPRFKFVLETLEDIKAKVAKGSIQEAIEVLARSKVDELNLEVLKEQLVARAKSELNTKLTKVQIEKMIRSAKADIAVKEGANPNQWFDAWLARLFVDHFYTTNHKGDSIMYMGKSFYVFKNGLWSPVEDSLISSQISKLINTIIKSNDPSYRDVKAALIATGRDYISSTIAAVVRCVENECAMDLNEDPLGLTKAQYKAIFNCTNVEVHVDEKGVITSGHNPSSGLNVRLGVEYKPKAKAKLWLQVLNEIFGDKPDKEDLIRHFHEYIGYHLQTSRPIPVFGIWKGKGANGKSLLTEIFIAMLGHQAVSAQEMSNFEQSKSSAHAYAGLVGKHLLVDKDLAEGSYLPDSLLKKLEGSMLTANPKFKSEFQFYNRALALILSNHWPKIRDTSYGIQRRAMVIEFTKIIKKEDQDKTLQRRIIETELSGVLNLCIEGFQRLQARGDFLEPKSCQAAKMRWLGAGNVFAAFSQECLVLGSDMVVPCVDVYDTYRMWVLESGVHHELQKQKLYQSVEAMEGVEKREGKSRVLKFHGVGIKKLDTEPIEINMDDV